MAGAAMGWSDESNQSTRASNRKSHRLTGIFMRESEYGNRLRTIE